MSNARFKLMAGLAGATLCLFAVSSYGQNTNAQTTPPAGAGTAGSVDQQQAAPTTQGTQPTTTGTATTPTTTTDGSITSTATDVTTTSRTFPMWGIIAAVVVVLLILVALFRGRDRTVIRETSVSSSTSSPGNRSTGTASATDDRARAASGTGNTSGTNDPNLRR
jgi:disulfide bond formation protein DsbB